MLFINVWRKVKMEVTTVNTNLKNKNAAGGDSGFTLIELFVVITIIGIAIGLFLPETQRLREAAGKIKVSDQLGKAAAAGAIFRQQRGRFPESLIDLGEFCAAHPELCAELSQIGSGKKDGYNFFISQSAENIWKLEAEPTYPGITGAESFILEQVRLANGEFRNRTNSFPTPGSDQARKKMFDNIRAEGSGKIAELLKLDPRTLTEIRRYESSPGNIEQIFNMFDRDGNREISINEIRGFETRNFDPELAKPLNEFLSFVGQEMKFDVMNDNSDDEPGVNISVYPGNTTSVFSFEMNCNLTNVYVTKENVAQKMCAFLRAAESAENRGDSQSKQRFLRRFIQEADEQTHQTLTRKNAVTLIYLAQTL